MFLILKFKNHWFNGYVSTAVPEFLQVKIL